MESGGSDIHEARVTDLIERLLATPGVGIKLERDHIHQIKLRVFWDAFTVTESAVLRSGDMAIILDLALRWIDERKAENDAKR